MKCCLAPSPCSPAAPTVNAVSCSGNNGSLHDSGGRAPAHCPGIISTQLHSLQRPNIYSRSGCRGLPAAGHAPRRRFVSLIHSSPQLLTDPLQISSKSPSTSQPTAASSCHPTPKTAPASSITSASFYTAITRAATSPSPMAPPRPTTPAWVTSCSPSLAAP